MKLLMSILLSIGTFFMLGAAVLIYWIWCNDPWPALDPEEWWGPMEVKGMNDTRVRPFRVRFSEEMIADLRRRLLNSRAPPPPLEGVAFQYGFNSLHLNSWKEYWAHQYNFTEREAFFNQFPQFKTNIQGLDVHFIWVRPESQPGVEVLPLILLHGWPGSVREFYELIPLLTRQPSNGVLFEVIAPSFPGFGFSDAPVRCGLGGPQTAVMIKNLMQRLGHRQFYMQGGDWGGIVAANLATLYPEAVLGFHTNLPLVQGGDWGGILATNLATLYPDAVLGFQTAHGKGRTQEPDAAARHREFYMQDRNWDGIVVLNLTTLYLEAVLGFHTNLPIVQHPCAIALTALSGILPSLMVDPEVVDRTDQRQLYWRAGGYLSLHITKPDSISIALSESPLGLLVYIREKISSGTDPHLEERHDEGLLEKFSRDQLLDNAMTYWVGGAGTAARTHRDGFYEHIRRWRLTIKSTPAPSWVLQAKHEILYQTPAAIRFKFPNLLGVTVLHKGGHFIALEEPEALAEDLFTAVKAFRKFHGKQKGQS